MSEFALLLSNPKIAAAVDILKNHNERSGAKQVVIDDFLEKLSDLGVTADTASDDLSSLTWETIEKRLGVPFILARKMANDVFRASERTPTTGLNLKKKHVDTMSINDLFTHYNHDREKCPLVYDKLLEKSKGHACVVYNQDGTVNVDLSTKVLCEIIDGWQPRNFIQREKPYRIYKIGESPNDWFYINPIYPHLMLRPDGTCTVTEENLSDIPLNIRQILYFACTPTNKGGTGELEPSNTVITYQIIEIAKADDAKLKLAKRCPRACMKYDELYAAGNLPTLRVKSRKELEDSSKERPNDPFGAHKRF